MHVCVHEHTHTLPYAHTHLLALHMPQTRNNLRGKRYKTKH